MKKIFALVFILLVFYSCSTAVNSLYEFDYPLTSRKAYSKNTNISVSIPDGWFTAEDNECKCIDLWLIKDDLSQSLNFNIINTDEKTVSDIREKGLGSLTEYNMIFVRAKLGSSFKGFLNEETFEMGKKQFYAYQYSDDSGRTVRVVLFGHNNRFYELTAISKDPGNYEQLWVIQNTVLTSLN